MLLFFRNKIKKKKNCSKFCFQAKTTVQLYLYIEYLPSGSAHKYCNLWNTYPPIWPTCQNNGRPT